MGVQGSKSAKAAPSPRSASTTHTDSASSAMDMVLPPSVWQYTLAFGRGMNQSWSRIGCESLWRWLPYVRMRFRDADLERQYRVLKREDTRESLKSLGALLALSIVIFSLILIYQLSKRETIYIFWLRMAVPLLTSIVILLYACFHRQLVKLYLCLAMTQGDRGELLAKMGGSSSRLVGAMEGALQPYYKMEYLCTFALFMVVTTTVTLHGHLAPMLGRQGVSCIDSVEHAVGSELENCAMMCLCFLVFKCDAFAASLLILVHQIIHYLLDGMWTDKYFSCFYPVVGILLIAAARQVEFFYRTAFYQTDKVSREKGQRRRLLESFAFMVDIAAWEWDTAGSIQQDFYTTRVIEALTMRARDDSPQYMYPKKAFDLTTYPTLAPSEKSVSTAGCALKPFSNVVVTKPKSQERTSHLIRPIKSHLHPIKASVKLPIKSFSSPHELTTNGHAHPTPPGSNEVRSSGSTYALGSSHEHLNVHLSSGSVQLTPSPLSNFPTPPLVPSEHECDHHIHINVNSRSSRNDLTTPTNTGGHGTGTGSGSQGTNKTTPSDGERTPPATLSINSSGVKSKSSGGAVAEEHKKSDGSISGLLAVPVKPDMREMVPPIIPEEPSITDEPLPVGVTAYKAEHRLDGFWTKHVVMADRNKIEQAIIRCADEGEPYDMEVKYERADGEVRWFKCGGRKASKNSSVIYGYIQDVTDRKRSQCMLEQRVNLCERVVEGTLDATMLIDAQDNLILESSPLLNLWAGRSLVGHPITPLFNSWMLSWLKSDAALQATGGETVITAILTNPSAPQEQAKGEMCVFVDSDDPARIFIAFKALISNTPPYLPLKQVGLIRAPRQQQSRPRAVRNQTPNSTGIASYVTGIVRWFTG
ncbi:unnamed protein product [Vitrella brassicaformis CCMP3155]|uniref:PAC domain-containing protein n=2 Tax=Vitrella brassicaformis TaxID=1169539 RepID=A0A0G4FFW9_VITBC|nr:unnamed protein product [Vitrella brassicaformis CCMP3155]|eukprot:CEM12086.1 unnamed protein product [Vitrella brassicaformis CCMP3155]